MEYVDCTPTWLDVLQIAKNLAAGNKPLINILEELEKPCQFLDNHIKENKK